MRRDRLLTMWCVVALLGSAAWAHAQLVWRQDTGWVDVTDAPAKAAAARYSHAAGLMTLGHYAVALEQLQGVNLQALPQRRGDLVRMRIAECLFHLRRYDEAAATVGALLVGRPEEVVAEAQQLRYRIAIAARQAKPSLAVELLDDLLGFRPRARARRQWPAGDFIAAAETYMALGRRVSAVRTLQRCREAYPGKLCPPSALRLMGQAHMAAAIAANATGARPQLAEKAFAEYLQLAPESADSAQVQELIAWLQELQRTPSADRRRVLYAAMQLYRSTPEEAKAAYRTLEQVIRARPGTNEAEMAAFFRAPALDAMGRTADAVEANDNFMKHYPASGFYERASRLAFELGCRLLGRDSEQGVRAMETVLDRNPRGPLADNALHEKAKYLLSNRRHPEAIRAFRSVLEDYPASDVAAEALFRLGQATLAQSEYHPERQAVYSRAREAFELYLRRYPHGRFAEAAQAAARDCREREAQHLYEVAEFYRKQGKEESATIYMKLLEERYPGTRHATKGAASDGAEGAKP